MAASNSKADSLFGTISAVFRLGLMLVGIIGLSVETFRDKGWLKQTLGALINSSTGIYSVVIVFFILFLLNRILSKPTDGKTSLVGDIPLYIMMAIGAFFVFNLITTGSF